MADARHSRRTHDIMALITNNYETVVSKDMRYLVVKFHGPADTPYEGGVWRVHVYLPDEYPFRSPSVGFESYKIYHPNVDLISGTVCLDIINQNWTALYELINIFDTFLPQLLHYPNPDDPLNFAAAKLMIKDRRQFNSYVAKFVQRHATPLTVADRADDKGSDLSDLIKWHVMSNHAAKAVNKG